MTGPRHRIRRQILEVTLGDQDGAWQLQSELGRIQRESLEAIIDRCCTGAGDPQRIHRIESIEVDLGEIERDDLERCLVERLAPLLLAALSAKISEADDAILQDGSDPEAASSLELLALFARTGSLPWWADAGEPHVVDDAVEALLQRAAAPLMALMRTLARERDQLRRVVRHCQEKRLWGLFRGLLGSSSARQSQRGAELGALLVRAPRVADVVESKRALWVAALRAASVEESAHEDSVSFWRGALAHVALELAVSFVAPVAMLREARSVGAPDPVAAMLAALARELGGGSAVGGAVASGSVTEQSVEVGSGATGEDRATGTVEGEDEWDGLAAARRLLGEASERAAEGQPASLATNAETETQARSGAGEVEASDELAGARGLLSEANERATKAPLSSPGMGAEREAGVVDELAGARRLLREASEQVTAALSMPPGTGADGTREVEAPDELAGVRRLLREASERVTAASSTPRRLLGKASERVTEASPTPPEMGAETEVGAGEVEAPDELAGARRLLDEASERAIEVPPSSPRMGAETEVGAGEVEAPDELAGARRLLDEASERATEAPLSSPGTSAEAEAKARVGAGEVEAPDEPAGVRRLLGEASERVTAATPSSPGLTVETEAEARDGTGEVEALGELEGAGRPLGEASERVTAASPTPPGTGADTEAEARSAANEVEASDEFAGARRLLGEASERVTAATPSSPELTVEAEAEARDGTCAVEALYELAGAGRLLGEASERVTAASPTPPATGAESEAEARDGTGEVEARDELTRAGRLLGEASERATAATASSPGTGAETEARARPEARARSAAREAEAPDELVAARRLLGETVEPTGAAAPASPGPGAETDTQASADTREAEGPDELVATRALLHETLEPATAPPPTLPGTDAEASFGTREVAAPNELAATRAPSTSAEPGSEPEATGVTPSEALPEPTRQEPVRYGPGEPPRGDVLAASEMAALQVTLARLERSGIPAPNLVTALRELAAHIPVHRRQALLAASRELAHLCSTLGPVAPRTARSFTAWLHQVIVLDVLPADALVRGLAALESLKQRQARSSPTPRRPPKTRTSGPDLSDDVYVDNAGLVVLWPFLGPFFDRLGLMTERRFNDERARCRAVGLLQHVSSGDLDPPEYQLVLAKVLCGMGAREEFDFGPPVTEVEAEESADLLAAIIANAPILGEMSIDGFRGSFLLRKGALGTRDAAWLLRAERASYDVVLDRLPWSFGWVKLPWMEAALCVEW